MAPLLTVASAAALAAALIEGAPAPSPPAGGGVHHLPLYRRFPAEGRKRSVDFELTGDELVHARLAEVDALAYKYGLAPSERLAKRASNATAELAGNSLTFYTTVALGTPPVDYSLTLDTGSADLVLATQESQTCAPAASGAPCEIDASYYSSNLSTSAENTHRLFRLTYGTATASGELVSEMMSFGGFRSRTNLIAADSVYHLTTSPDQTGLWGLGWRSLSVSNSMPFLQGLWSTGQLSSPEFAFGFTDLSEEQQAADTVFPGGQMSIGGTNSSLYDGEINWIPVSTQRYWSIPLDAVVVGGTSVGISVPGAVIDTGSNLIAVPSDYATTIYNAIPGARLYQGVYLYPCSSNPQLSFTFGDVAYTLSSANFNRGRYSSSECIGAILPLSVPSSSSQALTIIGTPFLFGHYNAYRFEPPAVGFANLASTAQQQFARGAVPTSNGTNTAPIAQSTGGLSGGGSGSGSSSSSGAGRARAGWSPVAVSVGAAVVGGVLW